MNLDEQIKVPKITLLSVSVGKVPFINVFGVTDRAYEIVDTDEPYLLWEDGSPMLWEDGTKVLLENQTKKVWLHKKARK